MLKFTHSDWPFEVVWYVLTSQNCSVLSPRVSWQEHNQALEQKVAHFSFCKWRNSKSGQFPASFFFIFVFSTVNTKYVQYKIWLMTRYEQQTSWLGRNCVTNCGTVKLYWLRIFKAPQNQNHENAIINHFEPLVIRDKNSTSTTENRY